ncbi:MAG: hypothetical protein A2700_01055 [Candidatus Blackburnbacteria bacterium RIFCSPHIGHO2_01_FULL_44_64]|uniref:Uncharacterized protein n=1 Tax=Candidatus Blackburnbacteria bacterium RIFCSPHIGHO2_02_FULL_44_20 TaxID=1797516 RepID=A0A1G1V5H8_9BACT|nr:MAG: hypothetical protein A2700_01055 [Candidatus Blackburnbacteria bacterium RIFCSPHIGHO2_01_FULL_44_64]OGY10664.1 MAG: hypothetical protein A3D26_00690 [Candidatus Blackburnbacteria bacterium RIFCSPHIGHO2_02_FULL_44_20]OGY11057.1 MAG: hypothetical protein A3E16_04605 [Candidatus Blackburnbacteria bacterium RIFCSPHIGHO2_12_FULL_44_25]OGY16621.1 MAG: hypothetical protein A3H88_01280 [Candidatus Blackburnbacteria bacterium RIFCSPLOWO2_02_FULL_44_9]
MLVLRELCRLALTTGRIAALVYFQYRCAQQFARSANCVAKNLDDGNTSSDAVTPAALATATLAGALAHTWLPLRISDWEHLVLYTTALVQLGFHLGKSSVAKTDAK